MRRVQKDVVRCGQTNEVAADVYGPLVCKRAKDVPHKCADTSQGLEWNSSGSFPTPMIGR